MERENKKRILVVDDEINVCKSMQKSIITEGYEVDTALSGDEALKKDQEQPYELIFSDLMLPGISGLDLITSLTNRRKGVKVVMVTGYPTIKTAVQSIKLGAFDYISKPFTPKELRSLVARAVKSLESDREEGREKSAPLMPKGLFVMRGQTWLRKEGNNCAVVGVVYDFVKNIGTLTKIELIKENTNIFQGEACARLTDKDGHIHRIWSPISGRIIKVNPVLNDNLSLLKSAPYNKAWLFEVESPELDKELEGLSPS
jgi:ActR/RegA family two-component response regulator/glycine cleavage system H lipoate-binding protein